MQVDTTIQRLTAVEEDFLVNYRVGHPTNEVRALAKAAAAAAALQKQDGAEGGDSAAALRTEAQKVAWTVKRLQRAREVQDRAAAGLRAREAELVAAEQEERAGLVADQAVLSDARRRADRFARCEALRSELAAKPRTSAQLDDTIASLQTALAAERTRKAAYATESAARCATFTRVTTLLDEIRAMERVDPERLMAVEGSQTGGSDKASRRERDGKSREGDKADKDKSGRAAAAAGEPRLDPSAPAFRPSSGAGTGAGDRHASISAAGSLSHGHGQGQSRSGNLPSRPSASNAGSTSRQASSNHADRSAAGGRNGGLARSTSSGSVPTHSSLPSYPHATASSSNSNSNSTFGRANRSNLAPKPAALRSSRSSAAPADSGPPSSAPPTKTRRSKADAEDGEVISDTTGTPPHSAGAGAAGGVKRGREEETIVEAKGRKRRGGSAVAGK